MVLPYLARLVCQCFAAFFLAHAVLGLAVHLAAPAAARIAQKMKPRAAARLFFALRLFPLALAAFVVLGLCVPSYLWLEPQAATERISLVCLAEALLGVALWVVTLARGFRVIFGTARYARRCRMAGREVCAPGAFLNVLVVEEEAPLMVLAGVIHPQLFVSRSVLRALSAPGLDAAFRHEREHWNSCDNLKRLLFLFAPGIVPFSLSFASLERNWAKFAEWAADDGAIAGDQRRSLSLATALVRVARINAAPKLSPIMSALLADDRDFAARVERLLRPVQPLEKPPGHLRALVGGSAVLVIFSLGVALAWPATLSVVHEFLERLVG